MATNATTITPLGEQRVLQLHNRYRQPGGEERYVAQLGELLGRRAAASELLEHASSATGQVTAARAMLRGGLDPQAVARAVRETGATIVHAHNIHPSFGWRALAAAREAGASTILHLHNYRLFCAIGIAFRDGHDCTECAEQSSAPALRHNCRGSLAESAVYAAAIGRAREPLTTAVDRFVAPVAQLADDLTALGFDLPISVLPTWLPDGDFVSETQSGAGEYALFAGRVAAEKGIFTAIEAAAESRVPLRVAGNGPDLQQAIQRAGELAAPVEFLGRIDGQAMVAARMGAACCLVPSLWREVLPFSALEALAAGLPLVVSDRGGLPELTEPQFVAPAGDASALAQVMRRLFDDPDERAAAGTRSLERAHERFSEPAFAAGLEAVYAAA